MLIPGNLASDVFNGAVTVLAGQSVADLDDGETDHSRIQAHGTSHLFLGADGTVELHDEVVALVLQGLMFDRRPWQLEFPPVGDSSDHPAVLQDVVCGNSADSGRWKYTMLAYGCFLLCCGGGFER